MIDARRLVADSKRAARPTLFLAATFLGAVLFIATPAFSQAGLFLHVVPTLAPDGVPDARGEWAVALTFNDVDAAFDTLPETLQARRGPAGSDPSADGRVFFRLGERLSLDGPIEPRHRKSSFVLDFHEAPVVALAESYLESLAASELATRPTIEALVELTDGSISEKNMGRGWDLASRVAQHGEGDCTEHAMLLAALARFFGYPARVVTGLALVAGLEQEKESGEASPGIGTFGHAWAEIYDEGRWRLADATRIDEEPGAVVRWLPLLELDNEGPGYGMATARIFHLLPRQVEVFAAEPAAVTALWQQSPPNR